MSKLELFGFPQSTYVRTARFAAEEKGVDYELVAKEGLLDSPDYKSLHPFSKIPCMRHGDFVLYETSAICRYIDLAFEGPALVPADPREAALMEQWISAINAYMDQPMIRVLVINRLVKPGRGETVDDAAVMEALPKIDHQLRLLDAALQEHDFLAGNARSIADFFLIPIVGYLGMTAEGKERLAGRKGLGPWIERMQALPGYAAAFASPEKAAE